MKHLTKKLDWLTTLVPFLCILFLCILFIAFPEGSSSVLGSIRFFLGDQFGSFYLLMGLGALFCSLYAAFSRFGSIRLGGGQPPRYSNLQWGSMMFTAGLAADILFYSLCEWMLYAGEPHISDMGSVQDWVSVYPLFHWGPIPWSFYIILAVAFGFMLHVRKQNRQKYSEACRPVLGKRVDGVLGRIIDLTAVFALLAGTATTFSLATPLLSMALSRVTGIPETPAFTIAILIAICIVYTMAVYFGMKGVARLASSCVGLFFVLLAYFFFGGGEMRYIAETGLTSLGNLFHNFIPLATWTDALRTSSFPQNWTIFYWAYWMVWCVAAPFFIGSISRGRTVRQTILGGYGFGVGSTILSFIILGNESMGMQMAGKADFIAQYAKDGDLYGMIIAMIQKIPCAPLVLVVLLLTMIAFYATSFDSIALTVSCYSYRRLEEGQQPSKAIQLMWCLLLILLPIALVFSESSMSNLQSVSIVAAFPIGMVILLIVAGFLKDAGAYLKEIKKK